MDIKDFVQKSNNYLSRLIFKTSFNPGDQNLFGTIEEPVKLGDFEYKPYFFRSLTGYEPSQQIKLPVLYTFFILVPPRDFKEKFMAEIAKKQSGQAFDEKVVAQYYLPLVPGANDFEQLTGDLTKLLELNLFKDKGYRFSFHLVCPTADYDFALIFIETNSVLEISKHYEDKIPFDVEVK